MATYQGQQDSYSNTLSQKVMITDRIIMADPYDITAIATLGLDNASKFAFTNAPGRTYTWLEDAYPVVSEVQIDAEWYTVTAATTITVTNGALYHVGDVVQVDDEYVWVSAVSSNTLTLVRGYASTTNIIHGTTVTAYIRYNARGEGAETSDSPWTEVTSNTNSSVIMHKEVMITRSDKLFPNYGIGDLKSRKIDLNMDALMEQLCRVAYYGKRVLGATALTSGARSAGGLDVFIDTNTTTVSGALLRSHIDTEFQQIHAAGGKTDLILCGAWFQRKINDFYEGFVTTERSETVGGMMIKQLMHPITGQLVKVVVDRHCPADHAYLLDTRYVGYLTIDPFFYEELAKTGDYELGQTVGEYGFVCAYNKAHSIISGFSTSA